MGLDRAPVKFQKLGFMKPPNPSIPSYPIRPRDRFYLYGKNYTGLDFNDGHFFVTMGW